MRCRTTPLVFGTIFLLLAISLAACRNNDDDQEAAPPDPATLVQDAATYIDQAESFRLGLRQEGPPTYIRNDLDLEVVFYSADAIFVRPDRIRAKVSVAIGELTQDVQIVAVTTRQYTLNRFLTQDEWQAMTFARNFNPQDLQSSDKGIGNALRAMRDIELVGREELDGIPVYHLRGIVDASKVRSVTVGLIGTAQGTIDLDVYIRTKDSYLARLVLKEPPVPDAENPETAERSVWTIDFSGYNNGEWQVSEPEVEPTPAASAS